MATHLNDNEYFSLRNEIAVRIQLVNSQENTALLMSLAFWGTTLTLCSALWNKDTTPAAVLNISIVQVFLLFSAIVLLIPVAVKSGENLHQISAISSYIRVFYEYPTYCEKNYKGKIYYWETAFRQYRAGTPLSKRKKFFVVANAEYTCLAALTTIMLIVRLTTIHVPCALISLYDVAALLISGVSIYIVKKIFDASCVRRNSLDAEKMLIDNFLIQANKLKVIVSPNTVAEDIDSDLLIK